MELIRPFFLVCVLCMRSTVFAAAPADDLLLYASFDRGMDADYAKGSPVAYHHENLTLSAGGRTGRALSITPNQWLRYRTRDNISLKEGTLALWCKSAFVPPHAREGFSKKAQYLAAARIRSGVELLLYLAPAKKAVVAKIAASPTQSASVSIPVNWKDPQQWHAVAMAWKQPGILRLSVDGETKEVTQPGAVPDMPSAFLYDLFLGSNAKQILIGPYGDIGHFDGLIDDVSVYSTFGRVPDAQAPAAPPAPTPPKDVAQNPRWVGANTQRLNVYLTQTARPWKRTPVAIPVDFSESYKDLDGAGRRAFLDSLRVVQFDPKTGEPVVCNPEENGDNRYFVPFQASDNRYGVPKGVIRLAHTGTLPAAYSVYYDAKAPYKNPFPREYPMVGNGELLHVGRKGDTGALSGAIRGYFVLWDADGDGDLDLWFKSGSTVRQNEHLMDGNYFYENIGTPQKPLFAPPQLIFRDNPPFGELRRSLAPQLADVDGDGKLDLVFIGGWLRAWAPFAMQGGKPVVGDWRSVPFAGEFPKGERGRLYDMDGDGKLDLVIDGKVFFNQSKGHGIAFEAACFRDLRAGEAAGDKLPPFVSGNNGWDVPVDMNGDRVADFLSEGFITQPYLRESSGKNGYLPARPLLTRAGHEIEIPGVFTAPAVADIDGDGDLDLVWSSDKAFIGWNENVSFPGSAPFLLKQTRYLQQVNPPLDPGALSIPVMVDWDDDGDLDLIVGTSDEFVYYYENTGTNDLPVYRGPQRLNADDAPIVVRAGRYGSIQGSEENDWGYLNPAVADWNGDGLKDLILGGIDGRLRLYLNVGCKGSPKLTDAGFIQVDWPGKPPAYEWIRYTPQGNEFVGTQRDRPALLDWNGDGVMDIVTLDHENQLALFLGKKKDGQIVVEPGKRIFTFERPYAHGLYLVRPEREQWVPEKSFFHYTGRTITNFADWDHDGDFDLVWDNANGRLYENTGSNAAPHMVDRGDLADDRLVRHNTGPDIADVDGDGWLDMVCGSEAGQIFYYSRPFIERDVPQVIPMGVQRK